jgi:hypothetical protein
MKEAVKFENGDPSALRYEDVPDRGSERLSREQGSTTPAAPEVFSTPMTAGYAPRH